MWFIAFFLALALAATLFYSGEIGRWNDDYYFLRQFDRAAPDGHFDAPMPVRSWFLDDRLHFWRPLYRYVYAPIVTALYQHPSLLHIMAACVHTAVSLALFAFIRRLGTNHTPAAIAALAFLVYPAHFEGAFWLACTPTPVATGLMLAALWTQVHWADILRVGPLPALNRALLFTLAPALLVFATCCLNEQPAFITAAMPVAILSTRRLGRAASAKSGSPRASRKWLVFLPTLAAFTSLFTYILISTSLYPRKLNPRVGGIIRPEDWLVRVEHFVGDITTCHTLKHFAAGAWISGCHALGDRSILAIITFLTLTVLGVAWVLCRPRSLHDTNDATANLSTSGDFPRSRSLSLALLGLAVFFSAWGPLALINYPVSPRLAYAPSIGLGILIAGFLELPTLRLSTRSVARVLARAAALPLLFAAVVLMIGIQHAYRTRWQADQDQGRALRMLLPNLPSQAFDARQLVFIPVRVADQPIHTGAHAFDAYFHSPLLSEWAAGWWLQLHFRRTDIACVQGSVDASTAISWLDSEHVQTTLRLAPPAKPRLKRFQLAQIIPFEVDHRGHVTIYTHALLEQGPADRATTPTLLPLIAEPFRLGTLPMQILTIPKAAAALSPETSVPTGTNP